MTGDYSKLPVNDAGIGVYRVRPGSTGEKSFGGVYQAEIT